MSHSPRSYFYKLIGDELERAYAKHGVEPWGRHELYGILAEEVRELEAAIFTDAPQAHLLEELVQVAAMCFRYFETDDRYRGPHRQRCPYVRDGYRCVIYAYPFESHTSHQLGLFTIAEEAKAGI